MESFLKWLGLVAISIILALVNLITISSLWGWFVLPAFNLPVPSWPIIYGLLLFRASFTQTTTEVTDWEKYFIFQFSKAIAFLGIGWIVQGAFL